MQSYKVFIESKALIFTKGKVKNDDLIHQFGPTLQLKDYQSLKTQMESNNSDLLITSLDPLETMNCFFSNFKWVSAAGGVVQAIEDSKQFLFIHRLGKWDLPKGKLEKDENSKEGAMREIQEECNIRQLNHQEDLPNTYHCYEMNGNLHLKKTYWFLFSASINEEIKPQIEEGIAKVQWIHATQLNEVYQNTYPSLFVLLDRMNIKLA